LAVSAVAGFIFLYSLKNIAAEIPLNTFTWIAAGAIIALGFLIPGLSPSNFLLYMGMYDKMTNAFKQLDLSVLIPIGIGGLLCVLALSKLVEWLLKKIYSNLFHFILGIVAASTIMILPIPLNYDYLGITYSYSGSGTIICLLSVAAGIALGWWMCTLEEKYK
jgi:putative membrane protein